MISKSETISLEKNHVAVKLDTCTQTIEFSFNQIKSQRVLRSLKQDVFF
jgi:hypothetical protein